MSASAFGAKRTSRERRERADLTKMTPNRQSRSCGAYATFTQTLVALQVTAQYRPLCCMGTPQRFAKKRSNKGGSQMREPVTWQSPFGGENWFLYLAA